MSAIDLNNPPPGHRYRVLVDKEETGAERTVRLTKDLGVFLLAVVFVGGIYWLAYTTVISTTAGRRRNGPCPSCRQALPAWLGIWCGSKAVLLLALIARPQPHLCGFIAPLALPGIYGSPPDTLPPAAAIPAGRE